MTRVDADIEALRALREAMVRFRYAQRAAADRVGNEIELIRASLAEKASRWQFELQQREAELAACRERAASPADDGVVDCSSHARAVAETQERLEHVRTWQHRVDEEASAFRGTADRFRGLLENDLPRSETHLTTAIARLEAARGLAT